MEAVLKSELSEAAGNLLAELYDVKNLWKSGRISVDTYLARVRVIRARGQSFGAVDYVRVETRPKMEAQQTFASISQEWTALIGAAETLKQQFAESR
jgi:hypothetical protein